MLWWRNFPLFFRPRCAMYAVLSPPSKTKALGAALFPDKSGSSFRVWAPNASSVKVLLQPDSPTPAVSFVLAKDAGNPAYWSVDIADAVAGHLYQFAIQNRGGDKYNPGGLPLLRADPCARKVLSSDPILPSRTRD